MISRSPLGRPANACSGRLRVVAASALASALALGLAALVGSWAVGRASVSAFDRGLVTAVSIAAESSASEDGELVLPELPAGFVGAVYDEHGTPRATTSGFAEEAPRSGALHPAGEPFDLARASSTLRAVMAPVPARPGAFLLVAAAPDEGSAVLARAAVVLTLAFAGLWTVLVIAVGARRLEREHERELTRAREELETQKRYVAFAAHELRGPLTLVHGQLALALRAPREADEYKSAITEALDAASQLRSLTEDLLDLERARGAEARAAEPVALARVVRAASRHVQTAAERRLVVIEMRVPPVFVAGRAADLERLLRNLLENAVRHSPPGGRVVVEASQSSSTDREGAGNRVELTVHDEGPGVAARDRELLFEPFFRGFGARPSDAGDTAGAGLGLAIARTIARAHGGDIALDPTASRGARFVVHLRGFEGDAKPPFAEAAAKVLAS